MRDRFDKDRHYSSYDRERDDHRSRYRSRSHNRKYSKERKKHTKDHKHRKNRKSYLKERSYEEKEEIHFKSEPSIFESKKEMDISRILAMNIQKGDFDKNSETSRKNGNISSDRVRKSRWSANDMDKCVISGMPTTIPSNMRSEDAEVYVIQLEIADITNKLKKQNYTAEIEAMSRLPSPDPLYGVDGKRINTKEYRARERLEERRKQMLEKLSKLRPELVAQNDKMTGLRFEEKVFIPQDDYPDINFAGLIIGPRGLTQKDLEKETGTRIILRGKGSVKCGKITTAMNPLPGEDEPLHAYVTAYSRENIKKAAERIRKIIQDAIDFPELENDLRKNQMKQLAILNGTYRETDGLNKLKMLSEASTIVTNTIICSLCGGTGHLPRDCKSNYNPSGFMPPPIIPPLGTMPTSTTVTADGEYRSFISELGPDAQVGSYYFIPTQDTNNSSVDEAGKPVANSFVRKFVFNN